MYKIIYDKTTNKIVRSIRVRENLVNVGYNKSSYNLAEVETLPEGKELYYENGEVVSKA